jgi:CBS domain-containing protein
MASIERIMDTPVVTVGPGDTAADAARAMRSHSVGAVLVVEGGRLQGIFTERDLVDKVVGAGRDASATPVSEVQTSTPRTVTADAQVKECAAIIREGDFRHLPVVDGDGKPVGIISTRVFLQHVVHALEGFVDKAIYERQLFEEDVDPYEGIGGGYRKA